MNRFLARARVLGRYRDAFLVAVSSVYVVGFSVWSFVAWRNGLGPMPVLDAQYFVAGLPPVLIVSAVLIVIRIARLFLLERWPAFVAGLSLSRQLAIGFLLLLVLAAGVLASQKPVEIARGIGISRGVIDTIIPAILIAVYLLIPGDVINTRLKAYANQPSIQRSKFRRIAVDGLWSAIARIELDRRRYVYAIPLLAGIATLSLYVTTYYSAIPQALGGAKPRCAALDLKTADLSPQTLLTLRVVPKKVEATAQTPVVEVYFAGDKTVLIGVEGAKHDRIVIEIRRDAVGAIRWCDPRGA